MCLCIYLIPDIRPPARRGCAPPPGLGFAFVPGVRGAISQNESIGRSSIRSSRQRAPATMMMLAALPIEGATRDARAWRKLGIVMIGPGVQVQVIALDYIIMHNTRTKSSHYHGGGALLLRPSLFASCRERMRRHVVICSLQARSRLSFRHNYSYCFKPDLLSGLALSQLADLLRNRNGRPGQYAAKTEALR